MITIRNMVKIVVIMTTVSLPLLALAKEAVGWHWYNAAYLAKAKSTEKNHSKQLSASKQMAVFRQLVREAKDRAILYPSEQNVRLYLILQNVATKNAAKFAAMWQKTQLDYPSLDYGVLHPTENNAQQVMYAKEHKYEQDAINNFRAHYGFFYFYRGNNLLDKQAAPGVISFCKRNKIALIPISVDGTLLPDFGNSKIDHGQAKKLGIKFFPALILVNPKTHEIKPVNYGFISGDELRRRFLQIATNFKEGI